MQDCNCRPRPGQASTVTPVPEDRPTEGADRLTTAAPSLSAAVPVSDRTTGGGPAVAPPLGSPTPPPVPPTSAGGFLDAILETKSELFRGSREILRDSYIPSRSAPPGTADPRRRRGPRPGPPRRCALEPAPLRKDRDREDRRGLPGRPRHSATRRAREPHRVRLRELRQHRHALQPPAEHRQHLREDGDRPHPHRLVARPGPSGDASADRRERGHRHPRPRRDRPTGRPER